MKVNSLYDVPLEPSGSTEFKKIPKVGYGLQQYNVTWTLKKMK